MAHPMGLTQTGMMRFDGSRIKLALFSGGRRIGSNDPRTDTETPTLKFGARSVRQYCITRRLAVSVARVR